MKKILLLGTGGTIACVPSADGLIPALDGASLLRMVPALKGLCDIDCKQLFSLDSSNLQPAHWQRMAQAVAEHYADYDGFVITHGTDTMAYTSAALSWMLHGCRKPVILTGAQLPIEAEGSDAPGNVLLAFKAACSEVSGVCLAFGGQLIHGAYAKKLYSEDFKGFVSINVPPLASMQGDELVIMGDGVGGGADGDRFSAQLELEAKVAVVKLTPGLPADILDYYLEKGYRGLVLESFGAGGVPNDENNWLPALERLLHAGVKIVCATQCVYDGVHLDKYPIGILAQRLGAESSGLLPVEAAYTKLMWELGQERF